MNLLSSALWLAFASVASSSVAAGSQSATAWQTPVEGCMNSWVSNGTWSVRVTNVQNLPDRLDLSVAWRNDAKKTLQPRGGTHSLTGFHGLSVKYGGPYGYNGSDLLGIWDTANSDRPGRNELGQDLLLRRFAPGATYKTVLHFYYPETYSATAGHSIVVPQKHKPIEFIADTVIAPSERCTTDCLSPIVVKLNCTK
jgi:hypothetical protein